MSARPTKNFFGPALAAVVLLVALSPPAGAQTTPEQAQLLLQQYNSAKSAFSSSDFEGAADKLEKVLAGAPEDSQLESVYYLLGASYFNLGKYDKAIETLKTYLGKYPQAAGRNDAIMSIGQSALQTKDYQEAASQFAQLEQTPLRERALLLEATALDGAGRTDEAVAKLQELTSGGLDTPTAFAGAMRLAALYGRQKKKEEARALTEKILKRKDMVENMIAFNQMAVDMGDNYLESGDAEAALGAYQLIRPKDFVIRFQQDRLRSLEKKRAETLAAMQEDAKRVSELPLVEAQVSEAKKFVEDARKMPDAAVPMGVRLGRAYYEAGKKWESLAAFDAVLALEGLPKENKEPALFAAIVDCAELERAPSARRLSEQYLREFPEGPNADAAAYLIGASALQANDPAAAETHFGRVLAERPNSQRAEEMRFLLANARFAQGKFAEAKTDYEKYLADFPQGARVEDATYRVAVSDVFAGQYEKGLAALEEYAKKYPQGAYLSDARYRMALCLFAAEQYDDVIRRCDEWEKDYPRDAQLGEVLALRADALNAKGDAAAAARCYVQSYKAATTDEVLNYSIFEAQKAMQKLGDWQGMAAMFEEFAEKQPNHPLVPMAMFWIGKAKVREGKADEAKKTVADTAKKYIDDPSRDAVEQLISQLAQLCSKRKRPEAGAPADAAPAPEPARELEELLGVTAESSKIARARLAYAKSQLALYQRKPAEQQQFLDSIAKDFEPVDLSPLLMALAGERLLAAGDTARATQFFSRLKESYPESPVADFAYAGLGDLALREGDNEKALRLFSDPLEKGNANQKMKDLLLGQGRALLALGKPDQAKPLFEQVASVREWRGESTAEAVYFLGEVEFSQGRWAEANAFFQRVFVAYKKYLTWVAKAYVRSAECFLKLNKPAEAARTCEEMLRNEKLAAMPEAQKAREILESAKGGAQ